MSDDCILNVSEARLFYCLAFSQSPYNASIVNAISHSIVDAKMAFHPISVPEPSAAQ